MTEFVHLHCHTQFSLLDGASSIPGMMKKAKEHGMKAVALTDHGNMFGAFQFTLEAGKNGIKPIIGCEFYVVEDRHKKSFGGGEKDKRFHQLLLAKNKTGYENLSRLCSLGFIEGLYGKFPRVDRELIKKYSEGIIATTCCIGAEVPQAILHQGEEAAEKIFLEWREIFGENYFIELQRHGLTNIDHTGMSQEDVNQILLKWSKKYNVPVIATNDSHYVDQPDNIAHDILLCINTGDFVNTPIGDGKGYRFGFPNSEFFFKTPEEMAKLFADVPSALENTVMIADMIEAPDLKRNILLPNYQIPPEFKNQEEYLQFLCFEGARIRYGGISEEVRERIDFELSVIFKFHYEGYFLIVQDFTSAARKMGVRVGPGRGSAAGSVVAYCLGITNVDPMKYGLLFERFLNPDRVSMPDIDIDFDDIGRSKVLDYVVDKYGKRQVAQIITYGSMAAKSSIRDVGRVLNIPLEEVDKISKMVPDISLKDIFDTPMEKLKQDVRSEWVDQVVQLRKLAEGKNETAKMLMHARKLEGSVRNTGVHACGVIITPQDITDLVPVAVARDSDLLVTQFDNDVVEKAGLLKMDFLGLRTLSIINDCIKRIEERHGILIDPDLIELNDQETYKLFQDGRTVGIFQFESEGMQKHLKDLKPNRFEDLIAMNALYRPGPLAYIPKFIQRKHGKEDITYDVPDMEEFLSETYGITVYQEQVMRLSQKLAGFTKAQADQLRKAMGKKDRALLDQLKETFQQGASERGHDAKVMEKVWTDWEAFAQYAFNKSHSTCYSVVAFQTAWFKTHYPAEYMSAVLTNNMSDIKKIGFFIDECKAMGLTVSGPDINESKLPFSVNKLGHIRFGLAAVKGVGEGAAEEIIREREAGGEYASIFDLTSRVNLRVVNKKSLEALAQAGSFDGFTDTHRTQYILKDGEDQSNGVELAIKYGSNVQSNQMASQGSLFGASQGASLTPPQLPKVEPANRMYLLNCEKEMLGMYLSGHPLDDYKLSIRHFCSHSLNEIKSSGLKLMDKDVKIAGIVTKCQDRRSKDDKPFGIYTIEDYEGSMEIALFSDDYAKFKGYLGVGNMVFIQAKMEKDFRNPEQAKLRIGNMHFLPDVEEKLLKQISIPISLELINEEFIQSIKLRTREIKNGVPVYFEIVDAEESIRVRLRSAGIKGNLSSEFIHHIKNMGLSYAVNA